jgi:hypothetical protein
MFDFDPGDLAPLMALSIPIIAIMGGIVAGIVRQMHRHRSFELIQRERIAAIERGLDPEKIAGLQRPLMYGDHGMYTDPHLAAVHRAQGLLIGGIVTLFTGIALAIFLYGVADGADGEKVWLVGAIPMAVGIALLVSWQLIKPSNTPPSAS